MKSEFERIERTLIHNKLVQVNIIVNVLRPCRWIQKVEARGRWQVTERLL